MAYTLEQINEALRANTISEAYAKELRKAVMADEKSEVSKDKLQYQNVQTDVLSAITKPVGDAISGAIDWVGGNLREIRNENLAKEKRQFEFENQLDPDLGKKDHAFETALKAGLPQPKVPDYVAGIFLSIFFGFT